MQHYSYMICNYLREKGPAAFIVFFMLTTVLVIAASFLIPASYVVLPGITGTLPSFLLSIIAVNDHLFRDKLYTERQQIKEMDR